MATSPSSLVLKTISYVLVCPSSSPSIQDPPEPVGTAAVIGVALRNHAEALADLALYNNLQEALTAQILTAVYASFLSALEDPDFGFGDVSPRTMLEHLRTEYGMLTPEELEKNRAALPEPWNFDDPIEDLWAKIVNIQRVAAFGAVPIPDITIITLTLAMIEKTGLLSTATEEFRLRPITEWLVAIFKADFILGNKERIRRLTAGDAGFHGAHTAVSTPTPPVTTIAAVGITPTAAPPAAARHVTVEGGKMFYCWTHGLNPQRNHTSITCLHKAEGHRDDATAFHMRGWRQQHHFVGPSASASPYTYGQLTLRGAYTCCDCYCIYYSA